MRLPVGRAGCALSNQRAVGPSHNPSSDDAMVAVRVTVNDPVTLVAAANADAPHTLTTPVTLVASVTAAAPPTLTTPVTQVARVTADAPPTLTTPVTQVARVTANAPCNSWVPHHSCRPRRSCCSSG
eukprot:364568-Chlamydomonas_euryale.AAC.5